MSIKQYYLRDLSIFILFLLVSFSSRSQLVYDIDLNSSIPIDGLHADGDTLYSTQGWDKGRVNRILPDGKVSTFATGIDGPIDIIRRGNFFYVSEWNSATVAKLDLSGTLVSKIDVYPGPGPMAMAPDGTIYVTHNINNGSAIIAGIDNNDSVGTLISGSPLSDPGGIDLASDGNLYVASFLSNDIVRIDLSDTSATVIGAVNNPNLWKTGHLKAGDTLLYISGFDTHKVFTMNFSGDLGFIPQNPGPGHQGGGLGQALFQDPGGISFDDAGTRLFVAKAFANTDYIQVVDWNANALFDPISHQRLRAFPNPSNGEVYIDLSDDQLALINRLEVLNSMGEMIKRQRVGHGSCLSVTLPNDPGIYFLRVFMKEDQKLIRVVRE